MSKAIKEKHIQELIEKLNEIPSLGKKGITSITLRKKDKKVQTDLQKINRKLISHPVLKNYQLTDVKVGGTSICDDIHWCEVPPGSKHYQPC